VKTRLLEEKMAKVYLTLIPALFPLLHAIGGIINHQTRPRKVLQNAYSPKVKHKFLI
jgi:hypothetical protein